MENPVKLGKMLVVILIVSFNIFLLLPKKNEIADIIMLITKHNNIS